MTRKPGTPRFSRAWLLMLATGAFASAAPLDASVIQLLVWQAAAAVAVLRFLELGGEAGSALRFFAGLLLGAGASHLGWRALYCGAFEVETLVGFSILFLPLGVLSSLLGMGAQRGRYASSAVAALPLAFATARIGCAVAGCCHRPMDGVLSASALEFGGAAGLDVALRWIAAPARVPFILSGLGIVRLASEPLRPVPPFGPPSVPVWGVAFAWVLVGAALAHGRREAWT